MTEKVKNSKAAPSSSERQWTRRMRCLAAALARAPTLPKGLQIHTSHPGVLERAFQLVLQYNHTPHTFDLTAGFRSDALLHRLERQDARTFHKLLGSFGQRYRFSPERTLQLATLVTSVLDAFEENQDWVLTSDGVTLHVVLTGRPSDRPKALSEVVRIVQASCSVGLAIHERTDGPLQIGLTLLIDSASESTGLGFFLHVMSPAQSATPSLPEAG